MSNDSRQERNASREAAPSDAEPDHGEELAAVGLLDMSSGWPRGTGGEKRSRSPAGDPGDGGPVQKSAAGSEEARSKRKSVTSTVAGFKSYPHQTQAAGTTEPLPRPLSLLRPVLQLNRPEDCRATLGARPYLFPAVPYPPAAYQHLIPMPGGPRPQFPQLWMPVPQFGSLPYGIGQLMPPPGMMATPEVARVFAGGLLPQPQLVPYPPELWAAPSVSHIQQPQVLTGNAMKLTSPSHTRGVNKCRKCGQPYMNPYHARDRTNKWICSLAKPSSTQGEK